VSRDVWDPAQYDRFRDERSRPFHDLLGHVRAKEAMRVVEWVKGTLLTDYQSRMPDDVYTRFLELYRERLRPRLSDAQPFFVTYKRILVWAQR